MTFPFMSGGNSLSFQVDHSLEREKTSEELCTRINNSKRVFDSILQRPIKLGQVELSFLCVSATN